MMTSDEIQLSLCFTYILLIILEITEKMFEYYN